MSRIDANSKFGSYAFSSSGCEPISVTTFSPSSITGLQLWLDANDSGTITKDGSNRISQWTDKSANAFNWVQSTDAIKPTYVTNAQNAKAGVRFTGASDQYLTHSHTYLQTNAAFSLFVVLKSANDTGIQTLLNFKTGGADNWKFFTVPDANANSFRYGGDPTWLTDAIDGFQPRTTCRLFELTYTGSGATTVGNYVAYNNGVSQTHHTGGGYSGGDAAALSYLGAFYLSGAGGIVTGQSYNGYALEICLYNSVLGTSDRQALEAYYDSKWSVDA